MESLKQKTARGLFWGGLNNGIQQLVGLVFGIILGRLLNPADYGMMAMITIFSLIAIALQNSGFITALTNLKEPTDNDYNSVFWFNIIVGSTLYLLLFLAAPLIAAFYHTPELTPLCRYAFLSIIAASFSTSQNAYLFKHMMVKQQAKAGITAIVLSNIVGAVMAFSGMSYWSLATQNILYVLTYTVMAWHYSPWRPSFHIDFAPVRHMFPFSVKVLISLITTHVNNNVLNILLGRYFSAHDTGSYNQAYQWNFKGYSLVQGMLNQVAQPVLVDLSDDRDRQLHAFRKMMRLTAFIAFPLLFGFALVAHEFILLALTEKWIASARLLQILCLSGAVMPVSTLLSNMILSKGKSGIYFWCTFMLGIVQILLMITIWRFGIRTMVVAYTLLNILWLFVWHYFVSRLTSYSLPRLLLDILPFCLAAAAVMAATYLLTRSLSSPILLLLLRIPIAAALYLLIMRLFHAQILNECIAFLRQKRASRK